MSEFPAHLLMIGCGNMAGSMLDRWLACGLPAERVTVVDPVRASVAPGVTLLRELPQSVPAGTAIVLGFKPQQLGQVGPQIAALWQPGVMLVSMLAGIPVAQLREVIAPQGDVVRIMPNTPVALGKGVVALYADAGTGDATRTAAGALMAPLGLVEWFEAEEQFNLLTALSGCGPAFVFRFIDALAVAATELGMDAARAERLALATVEGSAALAIQSSESPAVLADRVASPGGMTREGMDVMDADGRLNALMLDVLRAARDRGEVLAQVAKN